MRVIQIADQERDRWDAFVVSHCTGHLLQSYAWGELKAAFGWEAVRLVLADGAAYRAAVQILFRRVAGVSMAYVPRGPVVDWEDEAALARLLEAIAEAGRVRRAIFLKLEPNLPDEDVFHGRLTALGFRPGQTVQPRSSLAVDLDTDEETLLAQMKMRTRYNVRLAGRRGVTVRPAQGVEEVALFYEMLMETARRHDFGIHCLAYFLAAYRLLNESGRGVLLLAEREGEVMAAHWVIAFGPEAINFFAASRSEGQKHRPTYLLQWEAMRWAQEQGCRRYDFWGIPDEAALLYEEGEEEGDEDESGERSEKYVREGLWGVYDFKRGFGGRVVRTVGAYNLPYWPLLYQVYQRLLER